MEDDFGAQFYGNKDSLFNYINYNGTSIFWFLGYPNDSTFMRDPVFLDLGDMSLLNNIDKYFLSIHFSQSSIMDTNTNISREVLFIQDAGSLGAIIVNGIPYYSYYTYLERLWASRFYDQEIQSICEAIDAPYNPIGTNLYLRKTINFLGDPSLKLKYDPTVNVSETKDEIPNEYVLHSNYPNPFNPGTKISWQAPISGWQTLKVYDILGNEIATLVNEFKDAGSYEIEFNPSSIKHYPSSGVYFYRLQAGNFVEIKKMVLLK